MDVAYLAQLSAVLEASVEKPGNVSPTKSFRDASYEDFLFGSVALGSSVKEAAKRGFAAGSGKIPLSGVGVGSLISSGVSDIQKAHGGGNTHLGVLALFVPAAAAAGLCLARKLPPRKHLRRCVTEVVEDATVEDSFSFYEAVKAAGAGGIKPPLDEPKVSFLELMKLSSPIDRIASELSSGLEVSFMFSVPALERLYSETGSLNAAIRQTYLMLLAEFPDSLIGKKAGREKSHQVSMLAQGALEAGGVFSLDGRALVGSLDCFLREGGLNPGATADLVAAALFLRFLCEPPLVEAQ